MTSLALTPKKEALGEAMRIAAIADEQVRLMNIENNLEQLTCLIFPQQHSQSLDIDASIRQSLRHAMANLEIPEGNNEAATKLLASSLTDMQSAAAIIVKKYLHGDSLKKQHHIARKLGSSHGYFSLCQQVGAAAALLSVAHQAQLLSVLQAGVLYIDQSPRECKSKREGVVKEAWFWPLYSDHDEIHFLFSPSPSISHLEDFLAKHYRGNATIDEKAAFNSYAASLKSRPTERRSEETAKKTWKFTSSDVQIENTGIFKSLVASCLLQGLSPSVYLASVMTLIATSAHPTSHALTPREWRFFLTRGR